MSGLTASIHGQVLRWVMAALLVGGGLLIGSTWWLQLHEMGEVFQANLKQVALAVALDPGGPQLFPVGMALAGPPAAIELAQRVTPVLVEAQRHLKDLAG